jgi:hypothetical protein
MEQTTVFAAFHNQFAAGRRWRERQASNPACTMKNTPPPVA